MSETDEAWEGTLRRFDIDLLVIHPTLPPEAITAAMRWRPHVVHPAGAARRAPNGVALPGHYRDTRWRYEWCYVTREQWFTFALDAAAQALEKRALFLRRLLDSGGKVHLSVQFLGDGYFGDAVAPDTLARLARLGVHFGIEVFMVPQSQRRGTRRRRYVHPARRLPPAAAAPADVPVQS